jgi:hypothetical protein
VNWINLAEDVNLGLYEHGKEYPAGCFQINLHNLSKAVLNHLAVFLACNLLPI